MKYQAMSPMMATIRTIGKAFIGIGLLFPVKTRSGA